MDRSLPRGVTLVEVLVALVVLAFGALALARWQSTLAAHGDLARQRTEATRLAESTLELLRGFERVLPSAGRPAYDDIADGEDAPDVGSHTAYSRTWRVTGLAGDGARLVDIAVRWNDRSGSEHIVRLRSAIARTDPADSGAVVLPLPGNDPLWRPMGRHRHVPATAERLQGRNARHSTIPWGARGYLLFDDFGATVVARCAVRPADDTDVAAACSAITGFLLQGFIGGVQAGAELAIVFDRLQHLQPGSQPECSVEIAFDASGMPVDGVRRYRCLLQPTDHDGDPGTPPVWTGRASVAGVPDGTTVCRYATAAHSAGGSADQHETYTRIAGPLDHQNYTLVATGSCPPGSVPHDPSS